MATKGAETEGLLARISELEAALEKLRGERLRQGDAQMSEAQAIAHLGSWEWDLRTNQISRSAELCRIYGMSPDEAPTSAPVVEIIHGEDVASVRAEVERAIATRQPYDVHCRIVRADGVRIIHARGQAVYDPDGTPVRLVGTVQDITERRQVEERLVLVDRMASVGTLAAGIAHEINNPLAYVIGNLDLVAEELAEIADEAPRARLRDLAQWIEDARDGAEHVRKIVRGLRTFSRADEDRRVPLDVRRVLDLSVDLAFNELRHRARLVKDYQEVPLVLADEARLSQVFINLLVNAAQAMPEGQSDRHEVRLSTSRAPGGQAVIEVRDTGPGMSPEVLGRIFDPFFTSKAIGVGTGLGLSICHGIVSALGGEILVESEPGKGTVFRIVLPPAAAVEPPPEQAFTGPVVAARRASVLIVDDDATLGKLLHKVLKDHDVTVLSDARDARVRFTDGERFDLILCDLMMPEMTGMDLYAELLRLAPDQAERVVFMTGGAFTRTSRAFLDRVPNERLEKPFDAKNLRALAQRFGRRAGSSLASSALP